jgi:hypothetical protein
MLFSWNVRAALCKAKMSEENSGLTPHRPTFLLRLGRRNAASSLCEGQRRSIYLKNRALRPGTSESADKGLPIRRKQYSDSLMRE